MCPSFLQCEILKELNKARLEIDSIKRQMLQQEIAFNIQQTDALTRSLSPTGNEPGGFHRSSSQNSSFDPHSLRRAQKRLNEDHSKGNVVENPMLPELRFL